MDAARREALSAPVRGSLEASAALISKAPAFRVVSALPAKRVNDLLTGALEGGCNYWYRIVRPAALPEGAAFWSDVPFLPGGSLTLETLDRDEIGGARTWTLDRAAMRRGLQVMAEEFPTAFGDLLHENDDAETADIWLQCALFGELVFG